MRRLKGHRLSEGHLRFNGRSSTATRDRSVGEKWTEINQLPKVIEKTIIIVGIEGVEDFFRPSGKGANDFLDA